jgi:hypothetical protein
LVTPLSTFSIGAKYSLAPVPSDAVRVIIQNRKAGEAGTHRIYDVATGKGDFTAVVNGRTTIQVSDRRVLIDVTRGTIESIQLKGIEPVADHTSENWFSKTISGWDAYWETTFYSPFALSRWAYDDATIRSWYGIGFLWFPVRLVFALLLGVFDVILLVSCFFAAVATMLFGTVGRNIVYGLEALAGIAVIGAMGVAVFDGF